MKTANETGAAKTTITVVEMVTALCELGSPNRRHAKALLRTMIANGDAARLQAVAGVAYDHRLALDAAKARISARQATL